jgi:hypothetical protein
MRKIRAFLDAIFGESAFHPHTIRGLYNVELSHMRSADNLRILQHWDVDVEQLRARMLKGAPPPRTMLEEVGPVWANGGARGKAVRPVPERKVS